MQATALGRQAGACRALAGRPAAHRRELAANRRASRQSRRLQAAARGRTPSEYEGHDLTFTSRGMEQVEQASGDWRAFRAALVAQEGLDGGARLADNRAAQDWVHPIALPERGCLVLARLPDMEPAFADAVIFLLECDRREGTAGLVLNMPMNLRLRDVGMQDEVAGEFRQQALYRGGPVADSHLHILHGHPMADAREIVDGVYTGGLAQANALVQSGQAQARDFKLLAGYCGWMAGQLEAEVMNGSWWLVAAAPSVILSAVRGSMGSQDRGERRGVWEDIMQRAGLAGPLAHPFDGHAP